MKLQGMSPKPQRRISLQLRLMISAVFVAFTIFVVQYRKSVPQARPAATSADTRPFLTDAPSSEGSNRFAWIPAFPNAELEGINTKQTREQLSYGFSFRTPQGFKPVLAFYREKLQAAGFQVGVKDSGDTGGELHADSADGKRSFDVIAAKVVTGTGAEIGVTAVQR
jgi:hypothetical protein